MLYIVATPIGNLDEMNFRAVEVLKNVALIAAEDTRHSWILLDRFGVKTPMMAYEKFNEKKSAEKIVSILRKGKDVALISDAGMPLISDPGAVLVGECLRLGLEYTVVSGPCAAVSAVVLSGLNVENFVMLGFLPDKASLRRKLIEPYLFVPASLIFYSPPQSVIKDLEFLFKTLGARNFAAVKEISKIHEKITKGVLGEAIDIEPRGEYVLVVEGYKEKAEEKDAAALVEEYVAMGLERMDAIKRAARDKGISKSEVYQCTIKQRE
ncbi:MAG: 16S rRNA (cytidine(1402)-2'-O)-methyltransferase [Firmicutes bacterium]|nr:16S rRNA (cytidine(1402)-2'-O)-methyltransferase [Bacillota bacterium]